MKTRSQNILFTLTSPNFLPSVYARTSGRSTVARVDNVCVGYNYPAIFVTGIRLAFCTRE